jgi:hypothetical protein
MISVALMCHPRRQRWVPDLAARLDHPAEVVWDRIDDRHETGLRCLEAFDPAATHHLVVQDDALPCRDLVAGLERAVQVSGDRVLGLYVGNVRPDATRVTRDVIAAQQAESSWLAMPGPWWGVAVLIPTVHMPSLIESFRASTQTNYDRRIATWAGKAKVECWYTMPSLVDHRSGEENPSLVPGRTSTSRRARWFIGEDASALDVDWTRLPAPTHELWRHRRTGKVIRVRPTQVRQLERSGQYEPVAATRCGECGGPVYTPTREEVNT